MTPDALAKACADAMWRDDTASQGLGISIEDVGPGAAVLTMVISEDMVNGHGIGHGGFIFTLADSAFAFACNAYNQRCVAQQCSITYLKPVAKGDRLTATATEVSRQGRSGIYDIRVTDQDGAAVAEFRGHSRSIKGQHIPDGSDD